MSISQTSISRGGGGGGGFGMGGGGGGGGGMSLRMAVAALGGGGGAISGAVREVASNPTAVIAEREREAGFARVERPLRFLHRTRSLPGSGQQAVAVDHRHAEGEIRTTRSHPQGDVRSRVGGGEEDHR